MDKSNEQTENKPCAISGVMPRFFVDKRVGCIAIRDTQHPEFDVEHQGLNSELPDVVKFEMGTLVNNKWVVSEKRIEHFKSECASLNTPQHTNNQNND